MLGAILKTFPPVDQGFDSTVRKGNSGVVLFSIDEAVQTGLTLSPIPLL